jgi:hypothetical protein
MSARGSFFSKSFTEQIRERNYRVESLSRSRSLVEHDLFGKPVSTFPDHALAAAFPRLMRWSNKNGEAFASPLCCRHRLGNGR